MKTHNLHEWDLSLENAKAIQRNLRAWVITEGECRNPKLVGRIVLACATGTASHCTVQATISIQTLPSLQLLERKVAFKASQFPSEQGLQSFRKAPAILAALNKLNRVPDVFICDGRGITGATQFGVASHIGLLTNLPTIGVSAVKPSTDYGILGQERGHYLPVTQNGQIAALVRVLDGLDPVLVSPAHRIGLNQAMHVVLRYIPKNTPARDFNTTLYPASGINDNPNDIVPLSLVKAVANRK